MSTPMTSTAQMRPIESSAKPVTTARLTRMRESTTSLLLVGRRPGVRRRLTRSLILLTT